MPDPSVQSLADDALRPGETLETWTARQDREAAAIPVQPLSPVQQARREIAIDPETYDPHLGAL